MNPKNISYYDIIICLIVIWTYLVVFDTNLNSKKSSDAVWNVNKIKCSDLQIHFSWISCQMYLQIIFIYILHGVPTCLESTFVHKIGVKQMCRRPDQYPTVMIQESN